MVTRIFAEQMAYYQARAPEYDEWWERKGRYDRKVRQKNLARRSSLVDTYCTDGRLECFDADGCVLTQWAPPGGAFTPMALSVDTDYRLCIDDAQNSKTWIIDARSTHVLDTVDGARGHGMAVTATGDDIYLTGTPAGVRRDTRLK